MFKQTHKEVGLDIFDMHGVVDIRAVDSSIDRTAQIYYSNEDKAWQLYVYWAGKRARDWKVYNYSGKASAVEIGKDWVAFGIRPDRRWNDVSES